ncbi:serine hydrolase [Rossellomorea vietnamensis]|uniref:serine hydrolase n=1 Tax=Rossellomorea vietnamensis TaxID=218284 RepID=UPI003CF82FA2
MEGYKVKKWFQKSVVSFLVLVLAAGVFQPAISANAEDALNVNAEAAIIVEAETGKIIYEKNSETALGIASMTKMMTEYLLLEAVNEGKVDWEQKYTIPVPLSDLSHRTDLSNVPLEAEAQYTVKELYEAMAIYSANAATMAITNIIAGSESNFIKMMNDKAEELGLQSYKFVNSTGLNNADLGEMRPEGTGADEENVMSANDTAKLAFHLLNDYPEVLETAQITEKTFGSVKMQNWNWMLPGLVYSYEGMDGLKTGTTDFAGYSFTGTAERNGTRYITVVMDAHPNEGENEYHARFAQTANMLNYAFNNFTKEEIFPANYEVKGQKTLPVVKGKEKEIAIHSKEPLMLVVKNGEKDFKPQLVLNEEKLNEDKQLTAPIKDEEQVGYLTVEGGDDLGFITDNAAAGGQAAVVTADAVEKANWFTLSMRAVGGFFSDIWGSITSTVKGWF